MATLEELLSQLNLDRDNKEQTPTDVPIGPDAESTEEDPLMVEENLPELPLADKLKRFREFKQPDLSDEIEAEANLLEDQVIAEEEPPELPMDRSLARPYAREQRDNLQQAMEDRRNRLRNLALARAGAQIGAGLASTGGTGVVKPQTEAIKGFERIAGQEVEDIKELRKQKVHDPKSKISDLYRKAVKAQLPNVEISDDLSASEVASLMKLYKTKGGRSFQQSQYMTQGGDPVTFDPNNNQYINALTQEQVKPGNVIRNYIKTQTDPRTGEIIEVRPGIGKVRTLAGAPDKEAKKQEEQVEVDYTYQMLNPNQRKYLQKTEDAYLKDVKTSREFGEILANVDDLVESDLSAAIPAIKRQLARSVGKEVGVMTDRDVAAFSGDLSLVGALERFAKKQVKGTMTERDKEQFRGIINIAKKNLNKAMENRAGYHAAKLKNRLPDATMQSLKSLLAVEASKPMGLEKETNTEKKPGKVMIQLPDGRKGYFPEENLEKVKERYPEAIIMEQE